MNKSAYTTNQIRDKILDIKELAPNRVLKTEVGLYKEYNVSKMTLEKATDIPVDEGLVYRQREVGTFVKSLTESPLNNIRDRYKNQNLTGFSTSYKEQIVRTKVLGYTVIPVSDFIAEQLEIQPSDFVYFVKHLCSVDDFPNVPEETYMLPEFMPGLKLTNAKISIYSFIENTLQLKIASSHLSIRTIKSTEEIAGYLNLKPEKPVIAVT